MWATSPAHQRERTGVDNQMGNKKREGGNKKREGACFLACVWLGVWVWVCGWVCIEAARPGVPSFLPVRPLFSFSSPAAPSSQTQTRPTDRPTNETRRDESTRVKVTHRPVPHSVHLRASTHTHIHTQTCSSQFVSKLRYMHAELQHGQPTNPSINHQALTLIATDRQTDSRGRLSVCLCGKTAGIESVRERETEREKAPAATGSSVTCICTPPAHIEHIESQASISHRVAKPARAPMQVGRQAGRLYTNRDCSEFSRKKH